MKTIVLNRSKLIIDGNSPKACLKKFSKTLKPFKFLKTRGIRPANPLFYKTNEIIENKQREISSNIE